MDELNLRQVTLHDPFWSARLDTNAQRAIFQQWEQLKANGCIENFRVAVGEKDGFDHPRSQIQRSLRMAVI